jgi:peptidoglycan/LPS O-acetylase OafA/YrhL
VIVFPENATNLHLSGWMVAAAIAASSALRIFSWRFVQRPFRAMSFTRPRLFGVATAAAVTICVHAGVAQASNGGRAAARPR